MSGEGSFLATAAAKEWARTKSKKGPSPTKSSPATTPRGSDSASSQHRENGARAQHTPHSHNVHEEQAGQSSAASPPAFHQRVSPMVSSRRAETNGATLARRSPPAFDKERGSRAASPRGGASPWRQDRSGGFIPYSPILDLGDNSPRFTPHPTSPNATPPIPRKLHPTSPHLAHSHSPRSNLHPTSTASDAYGANPARTPRQRQPVLQDEPASRDLRRESSPADLSLNNSLVGDAIASGIPGGGRGDDASPREFSLLPQSPIMPSSPSLSGIPVSRPQLLAQLDERDTQVNPQPSTLHPEPWTLNPAP